MDRTDSVVYIVGPRDHQLSTLVASMQISYREFETLEAFLAATDSNSMGCVVANLKLFGIGGFDLLLQLASHRSTLPVIIVSNQVSTRMVVRAMREGACTVLESPASNEDLFFAVRDAMHENERRANQEKQTTMLRSRFGTLSTGEQHVLDQLCGGLTNREIASILDVHVRTVEARKKRLLEKTGSESIAQLLITYQRFRNTCNDAMEFEYKSNYQDFSAFGSAAT